MKRKYLYNIALIVAILLFQRIDPFSISRKEKSAEELQAYKYLSIVDEISSSIVDKYVATGSYFYVFNSGDSIVFSLVSKNSKRHLNRFLYLGDSVIKRSNSDTIRVIRNTRFERMDEKFIYGKEINFN